MPALTPSILTAQIKSTRAKTRGVRPLAFRCPDGWDGPAELNLDGQPLQVRECRSDLEARQALNAAPAAEVVLLVQAPDGTLAEDTMARVARGRLLDLNSRDTLLHLAGAQAIDPRLLMHRDVIDLLVRRWRPEVRLTTTANVIDCGYAFAFLFDRPSLTMEAPDLLGLLVWSLEDGMAAVTHAPASVRAAFFDWVRERNGTALNLIAEALKDHSNRLVSLGLALGAVFPLNGTPLDEAKNARIRLERYLGDIEVGASPAQSWHRASKAVLGHQDERLQRQLLRDVDVWLEDLKATDLAEASEFSPQGFDARLDGLAAALQTARRGESAKSWDALVVAEQTVQSHWLAKLEEPRLKNIRMALRLTRWLRQAPMNMEAKALGAISASYLEEGAFVDWARQKLRRGDSRESLNKAYLALLAKVDAQREETNLTFSTALRQWIATGAADDGVIPIEQTIERLLMPLAKESKVLFLVMDGMSGAVFSELMTDLEQSGWHSLRSAPLNLPRPIIAALPCITQVSRAALFRGRLDASDSTTEVVNFREHPSLYRAIQSKMKPQLFLKASLADAGGAGLSSEVRDAIVESDSRVVGVVINAIDDQLSTMGQLSLEWNVKQITWLKDLMDAAVVGERVVVLMSDHGHVPDKETDRSLQLKNAVGDRHRIGPPDAKEGEMTLSGPRLLAATGTAEWIFSQSESLRYGGKKSGYHGGVADQEVIVPLAILSAASENLGSFEAIDFRHPEWWTVEPLQQGGVTKAVTPSATKKKKPIIEVKPLELWAATGAADPLPTPSPSVASGAVPAWVPLLFSGEIMRQQKGMANRAQLADTQISQTLALLESKGGAIPISLLARELNLPQFRAAGFVAQLQRLLNVEGYPVLETDSSQTLRLNRELLFKQFDLNP